MLIDHTSTEINRIFENPACVSLRGEQNIEGICDANDASGTGYAVFFDKVSLMGVPRTSSEHKGRVRLRDVQPTEMIRNIPSDLFKQSFAKGSVSIRVCSMPEACFGLTVLGKCLWRRNLRFEPASRCYHSRARTVKVKPAAPVRTMRVIPIPRAALEP